MVSGKQNNITGIPENFSASSSFCEIYSSNGFKLVKQWLYIEIIREYTCQKVLSFSFDFWNIWCQTCESLSVNVTTHNSCNPWPLAWGYNHWNWCVLSLCHWKCKYLKWLCHRTVHIAVLKTDINNLLLVLALWCIK